MRYCYTCSHQQSNKTLEQTNSFMVYHQYIFLHTPHSTVFLAHLQTQAFLGVLWQHFHQATVTVRLSLQDPLLQILEGVQ